MKKFGLPLLLAALLASSVALPAEAKAVRSAAERAAFVRENPCPATGLRRGACPGYQVDHTIALCAGGQDTRSNMAWLSVADHRFKTFTDVRECRKLRRMASTPAR
ncbi:HNH endonuclease [Polaromonas sp. P2-4]|nr:HNH endonuclease [Polaromonas sp. P2-4]